MTTYLVTFEGNRIGRNHDVESRVFAAGDWGGLAQEVHRFARKHLFSRYPDVIIDQDGDAPPRGLILAGFHTVGRFTVEKIDSNTARELLARKTARELLP